MQLGMRAKMVLASLALAALVGLVAVVFVDDPHTILALCAAALATALLMSWLATKLLRGHLAGLVHHARDIARGESDEEMLVAPDDELLSGVAGSMMQLSEGLNATVDELARERNRLEAVLENMREAVVAVDTSERVTLINPAAIELLDLDPDIEPAGRPVVEILRTPAFQELLEEARSGERASREFELGSQSTRRVLAHASPPQRTVGTVVVMHDVTELRRLETVRRDFVANVSHELRTPVSVIRATAETLQDGAAEEPDHRDRFLDALVRNAERLSGLITDLLEISRVEAGQYGQRDEAIPVEAAVDYAFDAVADSAEERDIALSVDLEDDACVLGDRQALDQILLNLVSNAVKYTDRGGSVEVRSHNSEGRVRVEVVDDGPGIGHQHRDRIFERFYRVDEGRSREVGGTGLGLSIVKNLVATMGGDVGYEPAEPRGSKFWFELEACEER
ncbi:MAG: sensor histidine kinase [Persicimonas sp.]